MPTSEEIRIHFKAEGDRTRLFAPQGLRLNRMTWDREAELIIAAIGVAVAAMTWLSGLANNAYSDASKRRREKVQASAEEGRHWCLEVEPSSQDGWHLVHLKRSEIGATRIHLRALKLMPPGSLLATVAPDKRGFGALGYGGGRSKYAPNRATATRRIAIGVDLHPVRGWRPDRQATIPLQAIRSSPSSYPSPPKPSLWRWHNSRSVTITVEAEETSSARRSIRLNVTSQTIDWSVREAHKAK